MRGFCVPPRLRCLVDNRHWFNVAARCAYDDLSTWQSVHFWVVRMSNKKTSSLSVNRIMITSSYKELQFVRTAPGQEEWYVQDKGTMCLPLCDGATKGRRHVSPDLHIAVWICCVYLLITERCWTPDMLQAARLLCSFLYDALFLDPASLPHLPASRSEAGVWSVL